MHWKTAEQIANHYDLDATYDADCIQFDIWLALPYLKGETTKALPRSQQCLHLNHAIEAQASFSLDLSSPTAFVNDCQFALTDMILTRANSLRPVFQLSYLRRARNYNCCFASRELSADFLSALD